MAYLSLRVINSANASPLKGKLMYTRFFSAIDGFGVWVTESMLRFINLAGYPLLTKVSPIYSSSFSNVSAEQIFSALFVRHLMRFRFCFRGTKLSK